MIIHFEHLYDFTQHQHPHDEGITALETPQNEGLQ